MVGSGAETKSQFRYTGEHWFQDPRVETITAMKVSEGVDGGPACQLGLLGQGEGGGGGVFKRRCTVGNPCTKLETSRMRRSTFTVNSDRSAQKIGAQVVSTSATALFIIPKTNFACDA